MQTKQSTASENQQADENTVILVEVVENIEPVDDAIIMIDLPQMKQVLPRCDPVNPPDNQNEEEMPRTDQELSEYDLDDPPYIPDENSENSDSGCEGNASEEIILVRLHGVFIGQ